MTRTFRHHFLVIIIAVLTSPAYAQRAIPPETILASNEKVKVTYADFESELVRIPEKDRFEFLLSRSRLSKLVEVVLINKTMAAEAVALGLDKSPAVQSEIRNEAMKVLVKHRGLNLQETAPKVDLERRARETYLVERDRFKEPAKVDTWHVLVDAKSRSKEEAKKRAEEARKLIIKSGPSDEIAAQYSNDPSASTNKGRIGYVAANGLDPAYARVAQSLKIDEVSEVVESKFGFHVIVLKGIKPESRLSFEAVKAELIAEADTKYKEAFFYAHLAAIQSDPKLKVNVEALEALRPASPDAPVIPPASMVLEPTKK